MLTLNAMALIGVCGWIVADGPNTAYYYDLLNKNPSYSTAIAIHQSPSQFFDKIARTRSRRDEDAFQNSLRLVRLAKAALENEDPVRAVAFALEALDFVHRYPSCDVGDVTYYANFVIGRAALLKGDIESAKRSLRAAGKTPGSVRLDAWGPNMSLARELLIRCEASCVLLFLEDCKRFWKDDNGRLQAWQGMISRQEMPDFNELLFQDL